MSRRELKDDSGLIDLDALMKQADASPPAPAPVLAAAPVPAPGSVRAPTPARVLPPAPAPLPVAADDSLAATTHADAPSGSSLPLASKPPSRRRRLGLVAGLVAAGVAALVVARVAHAPGAHIVVATSIATAATAATPSLPQPRLAAVIAEPSAFDPSSLPAAVDDSARPTSPRAPVHARAAAGAQPEPAPEATAQVTASDLAAIAGKDPGDLGSAMRTAVGPREEAQAVAEHGANSGARQVRPSPGAVVGAINSVLPAARACLGPDDPIRKGSLVFRSDGSVARVDLRGTKTEDACVRAALSKARVEAFADDTFTTVVTIRP